MAYTHSCEDQQHVFTDDSMRLNSKEADRLTDVLLRLDQQWEPEESENVPTPIEPDHKSLPFWDDRCKSGCCNFHDTWRATD